MIFLSIRIIKAKNRKEAKEKFINGEFIETLSLSNAILTSEEAKEEIKTFIENGF